MTQSLKYNFVFFFADGPLGRALLGKELFENEHVRVYQSAIRGNRLLQMLFKLHCSPKINQHVNLPLKSIWFHRMFKQDFAQALPLCFIYVGPNYLQWGGDFTKYVKKRSPDNRVVVEHWDLISKKCNYDYGRFKSKVDLAITYDKAEAEKYEIHYFPETVYSKQIPEDDSVFEQDVYFLGAAKERHTQLLEILHKLKENGVKCRFLVVGVPEGEQVNEEGIKYCNGISYEENLRHVNRSRCLLELTQSGSSECTMRAKEAIAYRRKLLTNCEVCNPDFFHASQYSTFSAPQDIDIDFIKRPYSPDMFPQKPDMNPLRRLYDIQEQLEKQNG